MNSATRAAWQKCPNTLQKNNPNSCKHYPLVKIGESIDGNSLVFIFMNYKPIKLKLIASLIVGLIFGFFCSSLLQDAFSPERYPCPMDMECPSFRNNLWDELRWASFPFIFGFLINYFVWSLFQKKPTGGRSSFWACLGVLLLFIIIIIGLVLFVIKSNLLYKIV